LKPGGNIRIDMIFANGTLHPMGGVYQEIVEPEDLARA
jgi:hypothetical protein